MRFSARAVGCDGRRNAHPRPSYGRSQDIVMLRLIEEPVPEDRPAELIEATGGDPSTGSMLVVADDLHPNGFMNDLHPMLHG
jgi:hypothetical protein